MRDFAYYKKVLNIVGIYDEDTLKKAFRAAVKTNHPDKFKNPINKKLATEKMKIINEAYDFLIKNIDKQPRETEFKNSYNKTQDEKHYSNNGNKQKQEEEEKQNDSHNQTSDIIENLKLHIKNHTIISIEYKLKTDEIVNIEILPLEIDSNLYGQNFVYLKALHCAQNKVKTYRVDRIIKIKTVNNESSQQKTDYSWNNNREQFNTTNQKDIWNLAVLLPIITGIVIIISFFRVPYTVYMLLRALVCLTLLNITLTLRKFLSLGIIILFVAGIILYNPILPFHLSRSTWQILNIGVLVVIINLLNGYFKDE